jgi:hypothetical protein
MEKDPKFVGDLTIAIYGVIAKSGMTYSKENAKKVLESLGEFAATFSLFSDLDFDEFLVSSKQSHEKISKDESILTVKETYKNKVAEREQAKEQSKEQSYENVESLSGFKDKKFVKDSLFGRDVSYAQTMFEDIYDKLLDLMEEKNVYVFDMPVVIGCLGAVGAYFSEIYNVDKNLIVKIVTEYYKSLEDYDKLSDTEKETILSSYQPREDDKEEVSKNATVINFPTKKGPYNLN